MTQDVLSELRAQYHGMNAAEQKVARAVLGDALAVQTMSISELAKSAQTSDATVTRFCRRLGLSGFFALKLELAKACSANEKTEKLGIASAVAKEGKHAIDSTLSRLDGDGALLQTVEMIERARNVLVVGYGGTAPIAAEFASVFSTVSLKFSVVPDAHSQIATVSLMTEKDLLVLFSYSGSTLEGTELLRAARERGIPTVLITHFEISPSAKYADAVLCYGVDEHPCRVGSVPVRIAQLTLIDILFRTYEERNRDACEHGFARVTDALATKHI